MKLCTFNLLTSQAIKGVKEGYPLKLTITKSVVVENPYNATFIQNLMQRMNWSCLKYGAQIVNMDEGLPEQQPTQASLIENDELCRKLHHILFEIDVLEGSLQCPESGRIFPITNGIPNMLLNEHEV